MSMSLFEQRIALLRVFLKRQGLDGVLLNRVDNFAMATGGRRNFVNMQTDNGANGLLVTREGKVYCVANKIETPRQRDEELVGLPVEFVEFDWFSGSAGEMAKKVCPGKCASDDGSLGANVHAALAPLRALLTAEEVEKYRRLGRIAADAMTEVLQGVAAGDSEAEIAGRLIAAGAVRGAQVPVALVAADERVAQFRHPLPTVAGLLGDGASKRVRGYVMLVGGFVREGLSVSITRFRKVGEIDPRLEDAARRIAEVDAAFQQATLPGRTLGEVFEAGRAAYVAQGFEADEWHRHHQGGVTGYGARVAKGMPGQTFPVLDGSWGEEAAEFAGDAIPLFSAFAWNPSAPGVKSEDTFVVSMDGTQETLTETPAFPEFKVGIRGTVRKWSCLG